MPEDDPLYITLEAAELLRMTPDSLAQLRHRGGGPRYLRLTAKSIVYKRSDLLAWAESRAHERTDKPVAAAS